VVFRDRSYLLSFKLGELNVRERIVPAMLFCFFLLLKLNNNNNKKLSTLMRSPGEDYDEPLGNLGEFKVRETNGPYGLAIRQNKTNFSSF